MHCNRFNPIKCVLLDRYLAKYIGSYHNPLSKYAIEYRKHIEDFITNAEKLCFSMKMLKNVFRWINFRAPILHLHNPRLIEFSSSEQALLLFKYIYEIRHARRL